MPKYQIKEGNIPPDLLDYIMENERKVISITVEVERDRTRLRGAFHALLTHWYNSGCYSSMWNGRQIRTIDGLKKYYKYWGCDAKAAYYSFGGETSKDVDFFINNLPEEYHRFIVREPRHWEDMTMKQQCKSLHIMLSEIKMAEEIPKEVEESMRKLEGDHSALLSVGYFNYLRKHGGEHFEAGGFNLYK